MNKRPVLDWKLVALPEAPATIERGYSLEQLEQVGAKKAKKRGGFEKKLLLVEVRE